MWNMIWPIGLVVLANCIYNICAKQTPQGANAFLALTVTYLIAAVCSFAMFSATNHGGLLQELKKTNWTSLALGLTIVALEFGYICIYRAGWRVNTGSLVANISLACVLAVVGLLLYRETLSGRQLLGMLICMIGLIFISK